MSKRNLLGLAWPALTDFFAELGEPEYRAKQLMEWIYEQDEGDFNRMTNFPKVLREKLTEQAVIGAGKVVERQEAADGTIKLAISFGEDRIVECVILRYHYGATLCLSSQIGCKRGCSFCASGLGGFVDNLTAAEIIEQIYWANQELAAEEQRVGHLVYMGMGEPLDNYLQVLTSIRFANNPATYNIGIRNITVSTSGVVPGILQLAEENLSLTLSISLHAPVDYLRSQIMPINERYPIAELMDAVRKFIDANKRRVTFEYVLLAGFNDQAIHAAQLSNLVAGMIAHVNVIPYNEVPDLPWQAPSDQQVQNFVRALEQKGTSVTLRRELGPEIEAACGQLRRRLQGEE